MRILIAAVLVISSTLSAWALCAQASPKDCPYYMAVACHPDAVNKAATSGKTFAHAAVYDSGMIALHEQSVQCDELSSPDPYQPGQICDETDPLFWTYCDPFPVV